MSDYILLNLTRKEAIYLLEEFDYYNTLNITQTLKRHRVKHWTFDDDIQLYSYDRDLDYYLIKDYKTLNFMEFDKKANLGVCDCCHH